MTTRLIGKKAFDAPAALRHLGDRDPALGRLIARIGPFRMQVEKLTTPFSALARSIIYQQLTGKAAATIAARVETSFPGKGFPAPEAVLGAPDELLRGAGLSRAKTAALKDLAAKTLDGTVPTLAALRRLDDEAIIARLVAVRGIGRWTAEMLLIFRLGRPDVLPLDDYGVRKGFQRAFKTRELPARTVMAARGERWRPYRSVASWYLWRATDLAKSGGGGRA